MANRVSSRGLSEATQHVPMDFTSKFFEARLPIVSWLRYMYVYICCTFKFVCWFVEFIIDWIDFDLCIYSIYLCWFMHTVFEKVSHSCISCRIQHCSMHFILPTHSLVWMWISPQETYAIAAPWPHFQTQIRDLLQTPLLDSGALNWCFQVSNYIRMADIRLPCVTTTKVRPISPNPTAKQLIYAISGGSWAKFGGEGAGDSIFPMGNPMAFLLIIRQNRRRCSSANYKQHLIVPPKQGGWHLPWVIQEHLPSITRLKLVQRWKQRCSEQLPVSRGLVIRHISNLELPVSPAPIRSHNCLALLRNCWL